MPVEVGVYFHRKSIGLAIDLLQTLPLHLKPTYFSEEETVKNKKDNVADRKRFEKFIYRNPTGFFLFAHDCSYNLSLHGRTYAVLFADIEDEMFYSDVPAIFKAVALVAPMFGYAAEFQEPIAKPNGSYVITQNEVRSEFEHRNRHYITIGKNNIVSWIGRDLDKYIPGVYWYTLLSDKLLNQHHVDLSSLSAEAISADILGDGSLHLLKFFESSGDWKKHAARLDNLCERTDGVFSRRLVESAVSGVSNYLEYDDIIAEWR